MKILRVAWDGLVILVKYTMFGHQSYGDLVVRLIDSVWLKENGRKRVVGTNHLKLELYQQENPTVKFHAIAFDKGDFLSFFQKKVPLSICYTVAENHYNGNTTLQLVVRDIQMN